MHLHLQAKRHVRIVFASVLASAACAGAPLCQELEHSGLPQMIEHLKGARSAPRGECIAFAIKTLGEKAFIPAADILTSYLDFKLSTPPSLGPPSMTRIPWMEEYPAAEALAEIGLPATGSLVRAIGNVKSSDLLQANAEEVLLAIYKGNDPAAVALLRQASKTAPDANTAARLFESAIRLSRKCFPDWRSACEVALN
jgi:hypothetical protein